MGMTQEEKQAYEWALKQQFESVAARNARVLAKYIGRKESAQHSVQSDGAVCTCQVNAADFHGNCMRCGLPTTPRR